MKIVNRLFATAFVALLIFASHSRAEPERMPRPAAACERGAEEADCR